MCLDKNAMRSLAAHKGWITRRARADRKVAEATRPLRVGSSYTEAVAEGSHGFSSAQPSTRGHTGSFMRDGK